MIVVNNVSKSFGGFKALENINMEVKRGTIHGLIGENGAGKTTLLQMIAGIYSVDSGEILVNNQKVYENNKIKQKIGYVADRNQYFKDYRISELAEFYKGIYEDFTMEEFTRYNKVFKLDVSKKISELSKGMQMRLSLMMNLSIKPEVLILDEPTSGLDAVVKSVLVQILIEEVNERDMTVLLSSHHISELEKICDEVTIIDGGRVKYESDIDGIKEKVKKLQVLFSKDVDGDLKNIKSIIDIEKVGSIYYIVTDDYGDELLDVLKGLDATLIEHIGMTLEEIFVYTSKSGEGSVIDE